jgi:hypothetical protein
MKLRAGLPGEVVKVWLWTRGRSEFKFALQNDREDLEETIMDDCANSGSSSRCNRNHVANGSNSISRPGN